MATGYVYHVCMAERTARRHHRGPPAAAAVLTPPSTFRQVAIEPVRDRPSDPGPVSDRLEQRPLPSRPQTRCHQVSVPEVEPGHPRDLESVSSEPVLATHVVGVPPGGPVVGTVELHGQPGLLVQQVGDAEQVAGQVVDRAVDVHRRQPRVPLPYETQPDLVRRAAVLTRGCQRDPVREHAGGPGPRVDVRCHPAQGQQPSRGHHVQDHDRLTLVGGEPDRVVRRPQHRGRGDPVAEDDVVRT